MPESQTIYEKAITTDRPAKMLARKHGFESVAQLAKMLPQGAKVIDVGAGASPFGKEVASLRPDITWVNFDYSYKDPEILEDVSQDAPDNLEHVAGDAIKLSEIYGHETFDAVFSYWLLPHLSIDNPKPAEETAKAIFAVTKTGGLMSVGPKVSRRWLPPIKAGVAIQTVKDGTLDANSYSARIVAETKLGKVTRYAHKLASEVATPYFGTTRYAKRKGRIPRLLHQESGEYVSPFSRKGIRVVGRLAVAVASHVNKQRKLEINQVGSFCL